MIRTRLQGDTPFFPNMLNNGMVEVCLKEDVDKVLAHNKYKRCLAMWLYLRGCYWRCLNHNEPTKADWYLKWMNNFQKLAEKFKEGE